MNQKDHEHRGSEGPAHGHKHEHGHSHGQPAKSRPLHRDWRLWAGVALALLAMAIYVMSMDESLWPGGSGPAVPADAPAPAAP
jgi:hypothetical protein